MAHKRNPVAAVSVLACAKRVPGLVATALAAMEQEHERAAGRVAGRVGDLHRAAGADRLGDGVGARAAGAPQVDPDRMQRQPRPGPPPGEEPIPAGAGELIDRALEAHRA